MANEDRHISKKTVLLLRSSALLLSKTAFGKPFWIIFEDMWEPSGTSWAPFGSIWGGRWKLLEGAGGRGGASPIFFEFCDVLGSHLGSYLEPSGPLWDAFGIL